MLNQCTKRYSTSLLLMIQRKKISKHRVIPIKVHKEDPDRIKGYDLIPRLYCSIFVCAKKESGKTNVIFKILRECTGKKTHLYIISSTVMMIIGLQLLTILKRRALI